MSSGAHRRGLVRLLLGAAFLLLGWVLVSVTPASADDTLTSVVDGVTEPVTSATQPVAEEVATLVEEVAAPAAETVSENSVSPTVTSAVEATTTVVESTIETTPVAPRVSEPVRVVTDVVRETTSTIGIDVVDPVVETVGAVIGTAAGSPVLGALPDVQVGVGEVTSRQIGPATVDTVEEAGALRASAAARVSTDTASMASTAPIEVTAGGATAWHAGAPQHPAGGPAHHEPRAGLLPAPSNACSGGSGGADSASAPVTLTPPAVTSVSPLHAVQHPAAGPVPDPGSRPD